MIFSFYLQISRSQRPPVFKLSHTVKALSTYNFKDDENHMILRNEDTPYGPAERLGVRKMQKKTNAYYLYKTFIF